MMAYQVSGVFDIHMLTQTLEKNGIWLLFFITAKADPAPRIFNKHLSNALIIVRHSEISGNKLYRTMPKLFGLTIIQAPRSQ